MEQRLREKDEELENVRKSGQRALDELQRTIVEIETRYKGELSRLKKKYESEIQEFEIQIETLSRTNAELAHANKSLSNKVKELEVALDDERRAGEEARGALTILERKRIALQTELEDVRSLLETAERARKNAENELGDATTRINELNISITTLTSDKRRFESDMASMQHDLDEALNARRAAEDRADRLQAELNRLADELRQEQENYKNAESLRKSLEVEIREITVRLEEAEAFAQREGKRLVAKLQARLRDLEAEFEAEQRRGRDLAATNRKLERALAELRVTADDDRRLVVELQDQVATLSAKVKTLRRQLEEAEEVVTITMNKYRKAQAMCEDAEHRADALERNVTIVRQNIRGGRGARSMSVTREVVRKINL
jgi:myosin heavy chain 6/7